MRPFSPSTQRLLYGLILLAGAAWMWASAGRNGPAANAGPAAPRVGFTAPDFSLQTLAGETVTLSELRGKALVVNLWATWCPPCRSEMPALQSVYADYQSQGLMVLAVNQTAQDAPEKVVEFAGEWGLTFPVLLDTDGNVGRLYQANALPTTFFVDRQGIIQDVVVGGPMAEALLRVRVEQLLQEKP